DLIAGYHPRLDHGVALPVTTLALVVLLQRIEAEHQGATVAVGTQAHVDPEHEAIHGDLVQQPDQLLPDPGEELLIRQTAPPTLRLALGRKREDQFDSRGQVQLLRTQLALSQYYHVLLLSLLAAGCAELGLQLRTCAAVGL